MPWIEIFRAGKYPQGTFTQSDTQQIAQHDDPQFSEAPVVIGHLKEAKNASFFIFRDVSNHQIEKSHL